MADTDAPGGKKTNVLTRKLGPLPMWAWTSIVLIIVIGYSLWSNKKAAATAAATASQTDASQVPQFVNQTYVNPTPPSVQGPAGPRGPAGPAGPEGDQAPDKDKPPPKKRGKPRPPAPSLHNTGFPQGGFGPIHPKRPARRRHPADVG